MIFQFASLLRRLRSRRHQTLGTPRRSLQKMLLVLLVLVPLHVITMVTFEGLTPFQGLWLTLTTMTTVGYGDYSAETALGRISTILLVFFGGIWSAFQSAATYFELRSERRERMREGRWKWNMTGHILLLNPPTRHAAAYLRGGPGFSTGLRPRYASAWVSCQAAAFRLWSAVS